MIYESYCPIFSRYIFYLFEEYFGSGPWNGQTRNVRITSPSLACAIWIWWITGCGRVTWVLNDIKTVEGDGVKYGGIYVLLTNIALILSGLKSPNVQDHEGNLEIKFFPEELLVLVKTHAA